MQRDGGPGGPGGGAGGLGSGGTFTGASQALEIYGDLVGAFSGVIGVDNTETTLINALSGDYTIKASLYFGTGSVSSRDMLWKVYLSESIVYSYVSSGTNQAGANPQNYIEMIIPAFSQFKITSENETDSNTENQSVVLVGRIYRG